MEIKATINVPSNLLSLKQSNTMGLITLQAESVTQLYITSAIRLRSRLLHFVFPTKKLFYCFDIFKNLIYFSPFFDK
ncbi:hypothetical protein IX308_001667 [Porphyromonas levii]|nr:hypothetical protein [Porphyromonas levii]MBR8759742.1 hypothetical protein [Porphyromonas levii]MBR8785465.1 hypothetical protein [Porphyromonas levii]